MDNLISSIVVLLIRVHSVLGCHVSFQTQIRFRGHEI